MLQRWVLTTRPGVESDTEPNDDPRRENVMYVIERDALDMLFTALRQRNFRLLGPTVRDGAIIYDDLASTAELPAGWTDTQCR